MTVAEYALHRSVSDSYVRRMRRLNRLVLSEDGKLIDVANSDLLMDATTDPVRGGDRTAADPALAREPLSNAGALHPLTTVPSVHEAVRRERLAKARLAELELGEEAGDLTRRKEVNRDVFTLARQAVERMRTMGSRLRTKLAAESDPRKCELLIDAEIQQVCEDMQKAADKMAQAAARDLEARSAA